MAWKIETALSQLEPQVDRLVAVNMNGAALAFDAAFRRLVTEFKRLPRLMANGETPCCEGCAHREDGLCAIDDPMGCPFVQRFGWLGEYRIDEVPAFLRRQAE